MAVRLDVEAVRGAVDQAVYRAAEDLLESGHLCEIAEAGGGVSAMVDDGSGAGVEVWVGVVCGALTSECACQPPGTEVADLCVHAVAVTLCAIDEAFAWSSDATLPSVTAADPDVHALAEIAGRLPHERLVMLLAEYAVEDERLAARLIALAGPAPTTP